LSAWCAKPPDTFWGRMLGRTRKPWSASRAMALAAGFCIILTVWGLNLMATGWRDALDPRLRVTRK